MQIRRNTKPFKTILEIISTCQHRVDRAGLVRLYITKAGRSIKERISVEGTQSEAQFFYDLNYQAVVNNLQSSTHQLYQSDDEPGVYFFRGSNKEWDETPFEFDAKIAKEFGSLPELPATREKGTSKEFKLPTESSKAEAGHPKKENKIISKPAMFVSKGPKPPDYKLKHSIEFTDLERVVFRPLLNKRDVLDHYNRMADYLLPYLKDRMHVVRVQSDMGPHTPFPNLDKLPKRPSQEIPDWVQSDEEMFVCNDKEHLLFYVELGCIEFDPCHSKRKLPDAPDYIVIGLDGVEMPMIAEVAHTTREILEGLRLPSHIKTDGVNGLHIYIPLDSKSEFKGAKNVGEYLCKLVRLKRPDIVALKGSDDRDYGKIALDYLVNERGTGVVAPYSFIAGSAGTIATPLSWDEVADDLKIDSFNHETIFDRLKRTGDPFEGLFKKRANADEVLEKMTEYYSFLL